MTQTILNCNEIPQGKIYPVGDLRTAKSIEQLCEYVDAGHPIATNFGFHVFLLRRESDILFNCDVFMFGVITAMAIKPSELLKNIKLAPLAYRNGRPLHVGGEIAVNVLSGSGELVPQTRIVTADSVKFVDCGLAKWRFADEPI